MKTFIFTRTISVEERYKVSMSDDMANPVVARNILMRQLGKEQLTEAIELVDSRVTNTGRISHAS